jgi:hypothetical protein
MAMEKRWRSAYDRRCRQGILRGAAMRNITGKTLAAFEEVSPGHWTNGYYSVAAEDIQTSWGQVTHLSIMTLAGGDVPWADKMDVKNKLAGRDKLAIEIYPPGEPITFGVYHIWVLNEVTLPFGLHRD